MGNGPWGIPECCVEKSDMIQLNSNFIEYIIPWRHHTVNYGTFTRVDITDPTEIAVKHWELERIGILPRGISSKFTILETDALKQHEEKTVFKDGRYETGLLKHPDWKDRKLKSNRVIAENRLYGIERRLKGDPELASQYKEQIDDLILSGRAELVIEDEEPTDGRTVWYLPHHPVLKKSSTTTKTRIVNDGASKGPEGISINDTLIPGPALQPDILAILIRFRQHKVALIADIEKMFHQIGINERDRDSLRFLWRDLKTDEPPKIYRMTRVENIFVDDVISGADSVNDTASLASDMKAMMTEGGFPLRKFISNKPECLKGMKEEDLASYHMEITDNGAVTKALGVK
ncbi:uncharacterized protein LOC141912264 [Tubulanus polymorphus]|uniref:uncharacterized protein LOC141912264 n=1 Tax=Tubulanus polymorphus TaxID=672921 RepID=UPI003DA22BCA